MHYTLDSFLKTLKIDFDTLMALGRENPEDKQSNFTMTVLCLQMSRAANGVSKLHGKVSREMWKALYGGKEEQTPIGHITNGIHTNSWLNRTTINFWMRFSNGNKEFLQRAKNSVRLSIKSPTKRFGHYAIPCAAR